MISTSLTNLSPNRNRPRNQPITKITIHHTAGNIGLEALGNMLARTETRASYNYGISSDGRIGQFVSEGDRSWASSNAANDHQAITIGVANITGAPSWEISSAAFESLIELCVDICRRNNIKELVFDGTPNGNLTLHDMFANTNCPGPYLRARIPDIVYRVNTELSDKPDKWALEAWNWAKEIGITDGSRPKANITRQEMITMLHRFSRL